MNRSIAVIYCDDIRQEVGNKTSLMGVYGTDLILPQMPAAMPKLCIHIQIFNFDERLFTGVLKVKLLLDDEVIHEAVPEPPDHKGEIEIAPGRFEKRIIQVVISPFAIAAPCVLRTRIYFDDEEYKGAGLRIRLAEDEA